MTLSSTFGAASFSRLNKSLAPLILLVLCLFPILAASQASSRYLNDDSYITLTYAKSLVNGRGFVFNTPPATLGTTTPLYALVVAGLASFLPGIEISKVAVGLSAACWLGTIWTFYLARRAFDLSAWQAVIVGAVVAFSGWSSLLGMEAYLFAFLLVLGVALFLHEQWLMTGVICGLLFLTRGEGILVLITLIGAYLIRSRSEGTLFTAEPLIKGSRLLIGFLGPVLSWSVYAYFTFGRFLPDTLSAKMAQRQTGLWQSFPERMFREWLPLWERDFAPAAAPVLNLWWVLVLLGLFLAFTRKRRWLIFLGWITLYILGYSILNVSGYTWYQLPVYFVAQLFFALGLIKAAETLLNLPDLELPGRVAMSCLLIFVFYTLAKPNIRYLQDDSVDPKVTSYLQLTDWLRANTHSVESVAYIEVGYLGYFTDNRIIDLAGLITPAVIPYVSQGDFASGFWQYQPDYYVYWPDFDWALGQIRRDPRFEAHYQPVASLLGPSDNNLTIYKRVTQAQQ